jgi:hypothetical protein
MVSMTRGGREPTVGTQCNGSLLYVIKKKYEWWK